MIEPGTRFAGRYRLEDRVNNNGGSTLWRATDETLARSVSVLTFDEDYPRTSEVVTAARAASRITDSRVVQVFDADDRAENAYVVMEWVTGDHFDQLISGGSSDPNRAAGLVAEAAEALTAAHAAGLAHLCLLPNALLWTAGGTVKVMGIGLTSALTGIRSEHPALTDTQGLGRLLYAGLTGCWPGPEKTALPPAPLTDEAQPVAPRQVRPSVPNHLDTVVCRVLLPETRRGDPISTPAQLADALAGIPRQIPMPVSAMPSPPPRTESRRTAGQPATPPPATAPPTHAAPSTHRQQRAAKRSPRGGKTLIGMIVVLVMVAIGIGGWAIGRNFGDSDDPPTDPGHQQSASPDTSTPKHPQAKSLSPKKSTGLLAGGSGGVSDEKSEDARYTTDDDASTEWRSQHFNGADFGRLRTGGGIRLDMGKTVEVGHVRVNVGSMAQPGVLQLRVGDSADPNSATTVAKTAKATGSVDLTPTAAASGQYVFVWFTRLPFDGSEYRAHVSEINVYGRR